MNGTRNTIKNAISFKIKYMKKGDKVTTTHVEGIFTFKGIDKKDGLAIIKQPRGSMMKVPVSSLRKVL